MQRKRMSCWMDILLEDESISLDNVTVSASNLSSQIDKKMPQGQLYKRKLPDDFHPPVMELLFWPYVQ